MLLLLGDFAQVLRPLGGQLLGLARPRVLGAPRLPSPQSSLVGCGAFGVAHSWWWLWFLSQGCCSTLLVWKREHRQGFLTLRRALEEQSSQRTPSGMRNREVVENHPFSVSFPVGCPCPSVKTGAHRFGCTRNCTMSLLSQRSL